MTDRRLLIFTTLARSLSFSETARQLGLTQPAVSKVIAALETELGGALFVRYGRSVSLTDKGYKLKALAEKILEGYSEIELIKE